MNPAPTLPPHHSERPLSIQRAIGCWAHVAEAPEDGPFSDAQEWRVVDVVIDVASGGKDKKARNGLGEIFGQGHRKRFDILLFWSLDRLKLT